MNLRFILIYTILFASISMFGQTDDPRIFQISGLVISKTTQEPIPYARIQINHTRNGALSNSEGFYSIPVGLGDTLYFNHIGYHTSKLIVEDYVDSYKGNRQYLYAINYMLEDSFSLDTVIIFPYDTPEELRTAVVNLDILSNSAEARAARENLDPEVLHSIMQTLPIDGGERLMVARQMYYDYYQNKNLLPTVGLDPITLTRFLQYVVQKTNKKKNKDLNYWDD